MLLSDREISDLQHGDITCWSWEDADRYARAIEAAVLANQWQPIETAPKDGSAVLGYLPGRKGYFARQDVCPIHWSEWGGGTWETYGGGHLLNHEVTRWQPLPPAPQPLKE